MIIAPILCRFIWAVVVKREERAREKVLLGSRVVYGSIHMFANCTRIMCFIILFPVTTSTKCVREVVNETMTCGEFTKMREI